MNVALDLGCSEFRSLRNEQGRLVAQRVPAVYSVLEDRPAHRRLLDQSGLPYSFSQGSLILIGEAVLELSETLRRPWVPLLPEARLPMEDPVCRQVTLAIIEALLPSAETGAVCVMSSAKQPSSFFEHVVRLRGYQTERLQASTALALAELQQDEFSGICLTFGAEQVGLSVSRLGRPLWEFTSPGGARRIEEEFADCRGHFLWDAQGNQYLDLLPLRRWLKGAVSISEGQEGDEQWLRQAYRRRLDQFWREAATHLGQRSLAMPRRPLPLVISGGPSRMAGFLELAATTLQQSEIPLQVGRVQAAGNEPYSVARGLLVHAALGRGHAEAA